MKRTNKKGFTIVELVIVIAVIAILAAVLIPNISSLVKKANQSADIQACRQMNTYLAMNEVTEGKDITKVYTALEEGGMNAENYKPLTNDTYYFWDSELNRILYTDANEKVLFPEEYKNVKSTDHQWYSLSNEIKEEDYRAENDKITVSSGEQMYKVIKDFKESAEKTKIKSNPVIETTFAHSINIDTTIELTRDIDMKGASFSIGAVTKGKKLIINGNGFTIKGICNREEGVSNTALNAEGKNRDYYSGLIKMVDDGATVEFRNVKFEKIVSGRETIGSAGLLIAFVRNNATVTFENVQIKDSTLYGKNKLGVFVGSSYGSSANISIKGNTKLENVKVISAEGESGLLFGSTSNSGVNENVKLDKSLFEDGSIANCSVECTSVYTQKAEATTSYTGVDGKNAVYTFNLPYDGKIVKKIDSNGYRVSTAWLGFAYSPVNGQNKEGVKFNGTTSTFNPINTYEQAVAAGWVYDFVKDSRVVNN